VSLPGDAPDPLAADAARSADADGPGQEDDASDAGDDAGEPGATATAEGAPRRRRRRRRRRAEAPSGGEPGERAAEPPAPRPSPPQHGPARSEPRSDGRGEPRSDAGRGERPRDRSGPASGPERPGPERYALSTTTLDGPTLRLDPKRPVAPTDDLELEGPTAPAIPWGKDDDGPPAEVVLAPDFPDDAPGDDPDPVSFPLLDAASAALGDDVASVAGVRFVPGGRVQWCDAGDADYAHGERVVVDTDRGTRLAWIAVAPSRRAVRDRGLRRVVRRASEQDLRGERSGDADRAHALRIAKDKAAALRLPLKVFRVEVLGQLGRGARLNVYYTSDERLDLRDFIRELSSALGGRIELRQLGVRDEAKAVGGIGSCGLTLCCTTWLPDFVPVSIKMAKDQGLVLSPTKVSGQCGRLKCCLVYEQAGYAELRKGLPKLGKRVIGARGEGRVVEVDVLRQRVRVSYGPGDTEVVAATEVRPMFPSGNQPRARADLGDAPGDDASDDDDASDLAVDMPSGLDDPPDAAHRALPDDDSGLPDDDPSSAT
jgi:cell fate regulator YaaT (PSP1 superfamily)